MKLVRIASRDNPLLVKVRKLSRKPGEYRKLGEALLEGEHLCAAWAERGGRPALQAIVGETAWQGGRHAGLAAAAGTTAVVPDDALRDLGSLDSPAPIVFVVPLPEPPAFDPQAPSVVLDGVQDAGNVGSILRSAAAFGFHQVVALAGTASLWSPKVLRAGMGAHFSLRLSEGAAPDLLDRFALPLYGASADPAHPALAALPAGPAAWAFGSEGHGLRDEVRDACRALARIPQPGGLESLNVAAAAAICLYSTLYRSRP